MRVVPLPFVLILLAASAIVNITIGYNYGCSATRAKVEQIINKPVAEVTKDDFKDVEVKVDESPEAHYVDYKALENDLETKFIDNPSCRATYISYIKQLMNDDGKISEKDYRDIVHMWTVLNNNIIKEKAVTHRERLKEKLNALPEMSE